MIDARGPCPGVQPDDPETNALDEIVAAIQDIRPRYASEIGVQDAIEAALVAAGIPYFREAALSRDDRPDFSCGRDDRAIAIEVKTEGSVGMIERQLARYLGHPTIVGLVLVTTRIRQSAVVRTLLGKPIRVVVLPTGLLL